MYNKFIHSGNKMRSLLENIPEYIDYNWLMFHLSGYASPRAKVTSLLKNRDIIRVKKGLYIPGPMYKRDYSRGVLANRIYGPSYVSFEYALSWYGFIPERVFAVTSASLKKSKQFTTPIGPFIYHRVKESAFYAGIDMAEEAGARFIIATPEKALADMVYKNRTIADIRSLEEYLFSDLRIEQDAVVQLDVEKMKNIAAIFSCRRVSLLFDFVYIRNKCE